MSTRPDVVIIMTDEERMTPSYESDELTEWRDETLTCRKWFDDNAVTFSRHYAGSLACVPSRPTLFTGQYPDVHGVSQTDGLGKTADDSNMRWMRPGEVPTLGHWFRAADYDTHYDGMWHISHADLIDETTGEPLATNTGSGRVLDDAVQRYLDADQLDEFGFSGWVGPEPHGAAYANSGLSRDPLIADRICAWLEDRYAKRAAGDADALRPFLLVASFVNPHDIVLFPLMVIRRNLEESPLDPPHVPPSPTDDEDLSTKPSSQIAYKNAYASGYGAAPLVNRAYEHNAQEYRDFYYRLHAEVDGPMDRVRQAVTERGDEAVIVRTSDHGDLLGSHGGLHQKWYMLYDEATRVPMQVARIGPNPTEARTVSEVPTSHVDLVPTLMSLAGIDQETIGAQIRADFSEFHPLPGADLAELIEDSGDGPARDGVYLMTRDHMLEGDTGIPAMARGSRLRGKTPMRVHPPTHVPTNFEALVTRDDEGNGHLYKIVRSFDDPAVWTEPHVRQRELLGRSGTAYRTEVLPDQWELYDLDDDPIETNNLAHGAEFDELRERLGERLRSEGARCVPERNVAWPYATRLTESVRVKPRPPARLLRKLVQRAGMHPDDPEPFEVDLTGSRALIVCTNHAVLDIGKPTGLFSSEMTAPYYVFSDAGVEVDLASPLGGTIPIDPQSIKGVLRSEHDDRMLGDEDLRAKIDDSFVISDLDAEDYDIIFLAGGWGAAFDLGFSDSLGEFVTQANADDAVIGGVCHGPLGLLKATGRDGQALVKGRRISAVTDKQVHELGIESTPQHPETELRRAGADFRSETRFRDPLANHWEVDGNLVTGQNQNAGPMVAREMLRLVDAKT
jgi:arylsulfatase A-like enzyme/putative intracellular protease/amidase